MAALVSETGLNWGGLEGKDRSIARRTRVNQPAGVAAPAY